MGDSQGGSGNASSNKDSITFPISYSTVLLACPYDVAGEVVDLRYLGLNGMSNNGATFVGNNTFYGYMWFAIGKA